MRDIGRMGESAFGHWCASAGLTANNSHVDQTGWDYFVEFDFSAKSQTMYSAIHDAAFECKVQVKSTDKKDRKLQIKLSNLRRLVTAPMPAFFVFIEFDGKENPQRVFVVHINEAISHQVLERLDDSERKGQTENLHKKSMTVKYDESHMLSEATGEELKRSMVKCMGTSMASYVAKKNEFLQGAGFEDGYAHGVFASEGPENIEKLIDMSIGTVGQADVSKFTIYKKRFGKKHSNPLLVESDAKLEMPDLKPTAEGSIRFRTDKLGASFSFPVKFYVSPFNSMAPEELRKVRIAGDFFDIVVKPFTGSSKFSFHFSENSSELRTLRDALKYLEALSAPAQRIYCELALTSMRSFEFETTSLGRVFEFSKELEAVEASFKILTKLNISNLPSASLAEISRNASRILEMSTVLNANPGSLRVDMPPFERPYDIDKKFACLSFLSTPIGGMVVGVFAIMVGTPMKIASQGLTLFPEKIIIERTIVRDRGDKIPGADLIKAATDIEIKYGADYQVVTIFDKNEFEQ